MDDKIIIVKARTEHTKFSQEVCDMIETASIKRGTGIAKREPEYISGKINDNKAIIALKGSQIVGFCYIEDWQNKAFVANSGLIVHPDYQGLGLAKKIKKAAFALSKEKYPNAKLFGITTSLAVMKINAEIGYKPVTFSELTQDEAFWKGCQSCVNYEVLKRTDRRMCYCTAMVCDLSKIQENKPDKKQNWNKFRDFLKSRKKRINEDPILSQNPDILDVIHLNDA